MKKLALTALLLVFGFAANAQPTPPAGLVIGAPVIGTCSTGNAVYNNSGNVGYQAFPSISSANPSATIGTSAVNGTATTFMTSDSAPALASTIAAGGPVGSSSVVPVITYNAAGQLTTVTTASIPSAPTGANPSATIGLTAVNGSAATFLRSDGAPALSQAIAPTWTGLHTFTPTAAASPTALAWSAQSVAAGTSNTAGVNWTFNASQGTGTGVGGNIIFQGAPHSTTGSTQNALTPILTLNGDTKQVQFSGGNNSTIPAIYGASTSTGMGLSVSSEVDFIVGGSRIGYWTASNLVIGSGFGFNFSGGMVITAPTGSGLTFANTGGTGSFTLTAPVSAGAATLQLGNTNAASPISQTVQSQGSRSGTDTNVSGGNLTVTSGNGTGNATGSSLIFQTPVAVASGTGAQTQTTGLTIKGGQAVSTGYTVATLPTGITGGRAHVTDQLTTCAGIGVALTGGGAVTCPAFYNGSAWVGG